MTMSFTRPLQMLVVASCIVIAAESAGAQRIEPLSATNVLDAAGNLVGRVVGFTAMTEPDPFDVSPDGGSGPIAPVVVLRIAGNRLVALRVSELGFMGTARLFYTRRGCIGRPHMQWSESVFSAFFGQAYGVDDRQIDGRQAVHAPDPNATTRVIRVRSFTDGYSCSDFVNFSEELLAIPAIEIVDLSSRFAPPFRLR